MHTGTIEATIATQIHGRYLVRRKHSSCALVGFHGYGESADDQMPRLAVAAGSDPWTLISIQGLHRFYQRRTDRVVASWMTRQDRELAIADNIAYVGRVIDQVLGKLPVKCMVFAGFSQGVAMAFRAAMAAVAERTHVIAVGGGIPPELATTDLAQLASVLISRGTDDQWYRADTFDADVQRLKDARVSVETHAVSGGHEWSQDTSEAARRFLRAARHIG